MTQEMQSGHEVATTKVSLVDVPTAPDAEVVVVHDNGLS